MSLAPFRPLAIAGALAALCAAAAQASPRQDYMLHCMGCHGTEGQGIPGSVPSLADTLDHFMRSPAGRAYVLRAPGAANSTLSDGQLAAVLNWAAVSFTAHESATAGKSGAAVPFTADEVKGLRHSFADVVLTGGKIYTADATHSVAAALAVRDGRIVFVGPNGAATSWIGPHTRVEQLNGRLVQSISIRDVIDAYTINGARLLNLQKDAGSIEVGKSADFIILDQDIVQLADRGNANQVASTHVLETWFRGKAVYISGAGSP